MNRISLKEEFDKFWNKIESGENFTFLRYGDGERAVMTGQSVTAQEGWTSPDGISEFGKELSKSLNLKSPKIFFGISCPCCDTRAYYWYSSRIDSKNITFANLFVNANYSRFMEKFQNLKRDAVFIGNFRAENKPIGNLNILKYYLIDDDCFKFFETKYKDFINEIKAEFKDKKNILFAISAVPLSEIIIKDLYENNPENCYIDFGSSLDMFIHEKQTRPYMDSTTPYAKQQCWMYNPYDTNFDVSVILTAYKKPENLRLQLDAIKSQTVKPKEILLFQDGIDNDYTISFKQDLLDEFDHIKICSSNNGVWERFRYAKDCAKSTYVCIFDDDTIPGNRWLENCLSQIHNQEGLYGTIGVLLDKAESYPYNQNRDWFRAGWDGNLNYTAKVDLVGHSWFLKREWLKYLFENTEKYQKYKVVGEDITLSYKLKQNDIETFVPPHPKNNQDLWGSLGKYAEVLGNNRNAISMNAKNIELMRTFIINILKDGYKTLKAEDPAYFNKLKKDILELKPSKVKKFTKKVFKLIINLVPSKKLRKKIRRKFELD